MEEWKKTLSCAERCASCQQKLAPKDRRILSVYSHQPICMTCKQAEEKQADYADVSKQMIAQCIEDTGRPYGEPEGYCFHHFCPFKC